jgi:hypothetical protein
MREICGRNHEPIYRIKAPSDWTFKEPAKEESLDDTTKSLCEFFIQNDIRITIHNFPSNFIEERIPLKAQIIRWKRQFDELDQVSITTTPQSFAGFIGLFFEASGIIKGEETTMYGWSMQIAQEHYRTLEGNERKSCYTVKVTGPPIMMEEKRLAIIKFARSFELIDEIGSK